MARAIIPSPSAKERRLNPTDPDAAPRRGSGRTPLQIADHNLRVTLEAIRRDGPLTRLELGRRSGLTGPGITNILRSLSGDGLITSKRRVDNSSGPRSIEFALNPNGAFSIGLRIHESRSEAVLIDLSGRIRERLAFAPSADLTATVEDLLRRLKGKLAGSARILGVGIGTHEPSSIETDGLRAALDPMPLLIERDSVAAVLAERTLGPAAPPGGVVLIIIDESIRAGLLLRGVPFGGVHGRAGSIGAMKTGADHVTLDSVAGLGALRARLAPDELALLATGRPLPLSEPVAAWIRSAAGHLLDAIVAMAGFVAPGTILIGGDLPQNLIDALIRQLSVERRDTTTRPFSTPWISTIGPASFGGAGIAIGAALLPMFETLLPSPFAAA